jgi:hypothetical protein
MLSVAGLAEVCAMDEKGFRAILNWCRNLGIASTLLGGIELMHDPQFFWYSVTGVCLGVTLIALDIFFEVRRIFWKIAVAVIFIALMTGFSFGVVFVKAPLEIVAFVTDAEYPPGKTVAGIGWRPEFTELQVWITNRSERNYDDVSILLRPSSPIAVIGQITNVPNVSFEDSNNFGLRLTDINPRTGTKTVIPLVLLATDAGYRMRCPHLPAGTPIQIVIALADNKWNPSRESSARPIEDRARDKDFIFRIRGFDDYSTYWYGHPEGDVYAPRPTSTDWVKVQGEYTAAQRTRSVSEKIKVAGNITIRRQP